MKLSKEIEDSIKKTIRKRYEAYCEEVIEGQIEAELSLHEMDRWLEYSE